jgi:glycosyltransferase involved in cell wall biosynthesis
VSSEAPTVSVVIPTYNRAEILPRAVDSVLDQTFADLELFVVDDASTDDTLAVVESYDDDRLTYIRHEENSGNGGIARNTALDRVSGQYVAFLDDDDRWRETKLEKQVALLDDSPERVGLAYCWMNYYDGDRVVERRHPTHRGDIFREMLDKNAITAASTLLVRRSVIDDVGGFDPDIPRGIDSDFVRRVAADYEVDYVPEVLVEYNVGHGYDRDSAWDESGIRDAIESTRIKFEKFPDAFERYPEMYASNLAYIACQYGMLGEWRRCLDHFGRALRAQPTTWRVPFQALRLGKFYLDRYLPGLGRAVSDAIKR